MSNSSSFRVSKCIAESCPTVHFILKLFVQVSCRTWIATRRTFTCMAVRYYSFSSVFICKTFTRSVSPNVLWCSTHSLIIQDSGCTVYSICSNLELYDNVFVPQLSFAKIDTVCGYAGFYCDFGTHHPLCTTYILLGIWKHIFNKEISQGQPP